MPLRQLKLYIIGSILVCVVLGGIIEFSTRVISWIGGSGFSLALHELDPTDRKVESIYKWHPFIGLTFRPGTSFVGSHPNQKNKTARIFVDNNGFLVHPKRPIILEKQKGEIRIAIIGASTAANINLDFDTNWPGRIGVLLRKRYPKKKITIINAAVPGYKTAQSIGNLALRVMPYKPDIVIIYHAYNDLKAIQPNIAFTTDYSHLHGLPYGYHKKPFFLLRWLNRSMFYVRIRNKYRKHKQLSAKQAARKIKRLGNIPKIAEDSFELHIRSLVGIARAGGAKVILSSFATLHDPSMDYTNLQTINRLSILQKRELYGIQHFTSGLQLSTIFTGINRYNTILKKVASEQKTGWVDNARLVPHQDRYFVDRVHFTDQGSAVMAKKFLPKIIRKIRR